MLNAQRRTCSSPVPGPRMARTHDWSRWKNGSNSSFTRAFRASVGSIISRDISLLCHAVRPRSNTACSLAAIISRNSCSALAAVMGPMPRGDIYSSRSAGRTSNGFIQSLFVVEVIVDRRPHWRGRACRFRARWPGGSRAPRTPRQQLRAADGGSRCSGRIQPRSSYVSNICLNQTFETVKPFRGCRRQGD